MLISFTELKNIEAHAIDGPVGTVRDLLFDEQNWIVRYVVVDNTSGFSKGILLIAPTAIRHAAGSPRQLRVTLTRAQVAEAPLRTTNQSVHGDHLASTPAPEVLTLDGELPRHPTFALTDARGNGRNRPEEANGQDRNVPLHRVQELEKQRVRSGTTPIGQVCDVVGDDVDWAIRYLAVHCPSRAQTECALLSSRWIRNTDWDHGSLAVDVNHDKIVRAPPYTPGTPLEPGYERTLHQFHGRSGYWEHP